MTNLAEITIKDDRYRKLIDTTYTALHFVRQGLDKGPYAVDGVFSGVTHNGNIYAEKGQTDLYSTGKFVDIIHQHGGENGHKVKGPQQITFKGKPENIRFFLDRLNRCHPGDDIGSCVERVYEEFSL